MAKNPRILVADDEEGIRESLRLILEDRYEVAFAEDGQAVCATLATQRFDLVLLDIKMPKLDGLHVMKRLKEAGTSLPPILVLTAYQSVELAKEAVRLGAVGYLPKPFDRDELLQAIREALREPKKHVGSNVDCKK